MGQKVDIFKGVKNSNTQARYDIHCRKDDLSRKHCRYSEYPKKMLTMGQKVDIFKATLSTQTR